ncbi:zf-UBP-domain-containing protein [Wallemia mellicola]|nr:zf-UBP-domain-containing protein [Wallemia mellicola]
MLSEEELKDAKLLVLANKQDSPAALPVAEVSLQLGLDNLKDRTWSVRGCSAIREDGQLNEALNWLIELSFCYYVISPFQFLNMSDMKFGKVTAAASLAASGSAYTIVAGSYNTSLTTYTFDPESNELGYGKQHSLPQGFAPSWIQESPVNDAIIAVCSEAFPGEVASTVLESADTHNVVNSLPSGGDGPASGGFTADGQYFIAANYASGSVQAYSVAEDGKITALGESTALTGSGPNTDRQTSPHPHHVIASPVDDQTVYIPDLGSDVILQFAVKNDKLEKVSEYEAPAGSGPRHGVFHPESSLLYVVTELSNEVLVYKLEDDGKLSLTSQTSIIPKEKAEKSSMQASEIIISSDGKYLYAANRDVKPSGADDEDHMAIFSVSDNGETLELTKHVKVGGIQPRAFVLFGAEDEYLIIGNTYENNPNVVVFKRDSQSGDLEQVAKASGQSPTSFICNTDMERASSSTQSTTTPSPPIAKYYPSAREGEVDMTGVVHLFKDSRSLEESDSDVMNELNYIQTSTSAGGGSTERNAIVGILAVPSSMSPSDLLEFIRPALDAISHIRILRDAAPNRYITLIKFKDYRDALEFKEMYDGIPFSSLNEEICRVVRISSVKIQDTKESASFDNFGDGWISKHPQQQQCTELPTCPPAKRDEMRTQCASCGKVEDLWICLICGHVGCGRYGPGHAYRHYEQTTHLFSLDLETQRVWDYAGDGYVHRLIQKSDGKVVELPSATSHSLGSSKGKESADGNTDKGGANDEIVAMEFSSLLASQLDTQRSYYEEQQLELHARLESLESVVEAQKHSRESDDDLRKENARLEKKVIKSNEVLHHVRRQAEEEKSFSEGLLTRIDKLIEQNESQSQIISTLTAENGDLKENVRDLMFFVEARDKVPALAGGELSGGTVGIAAPAPAPSTSSQKKKKKKEKEKEKRGDNTTK